MNAPSALSVAVICASQDPLPKRFRYGVRVFVYGDGEIVKEIYVCWFVLNLGGRMGFAG
jgi:hypothetical protein